MAELTETAFQILAGLFEEERDGSSQSTHSKVFPDDDAFKSWNSAFKLLKKEGLIADHPIRLTPKGRAEYVRIGVGRDASPTK